MVYSFLNSNTLLTLVPSWFLNFDIQLYHRYLNTELICGDLLNKSMNLHRFFYLSHYSITGHIYLIDRSHCRSHYFIYCRSHYSITDDWGVTKERSKFFCCCWMEFLCAAWVCSPWCRSLYPELYIKNMKM